VVVVVIVVVVVVDDVSVGGDGREENFGAGKLESRGWDLDCWIRC